MGVNVRKNYGSRKKTLACDGRTNTWQCRAMHRICLRAAFFRSRSAVKLSTKYRQNLVRFNETHSCHQKSNGPRQCTLNG